MEDSSKQQKCTRETIQRGQTSIYIFGNEKNYENCVDDVEVDNFPEALDESELEDSNSQKTEKCGQSLKRSTGSDEEETVIVVKKRGNKVFIEI